MPRRRWAVGAAVLAWMLTPALEQQAAAGSAGVAALQTALRSAGLYSGAVDGIRGPATRQAVVRFQRRRGLAVDGIAGPRTRAALGRLGRPRLGTRLVGRGQRGWDVAALQFLLGRRGHPPGAVDGHFGPGTEAAVRSFQGAAGLAADGVAGPATIAAVRRPLVPSAPQGPVRFYRPVPGPIGDHFGAPRKGYRHTGIDFPAPAGTLVQAGGVGTVLFAGWNSGGYGNLVVVQHRLGFESWYAHLSQITSWVGEAVQGGTRVGYVGATGRATGPHLHFEVRVNGNQIDPFPYLLPGPAVVARAGGSCRPRGPVDPRTARIDRC